MSDQFTAQLNSGEARLSLAERALGAARSTFAAATNRGRYGTDQAH